VDGEAVSVMVRLAAPSQLHPTKPLVSRSAMLSKLRFTRPVDVHLDLQTVPAAHCSALTVAVLDLNDRSVPAVVPDWREPPVSIRFLRLTI
jgi:hypothetical protein